MRGKIFMTIGKQDVLSYEEQVPQLMQEEIGMDIPTLQETKWTERGNFKMNTSIVFYSGDCKGKHAFAV